MHIIPTYTARSSWYGGRRGVGNLVDPPATMINSAGDYEVSYIVSRFVEGKGGLGVGCNQT